MSVIQLLSSSLGVRDEVPNQKLAWELAETLNIEGIKEIAENVEFSKDKNIQNDCIKVLYEIGYKKPELISDYLSVFVNLLNGKNNRLIWGAMIAIDTITDVMPDKVHSCLAELMQAIDKGSVITVDAGVEILAKLAAVQQFEKDCFPLLIEKLKFCPIKQLGQYAEKSIKAINHNNKRVFIDLLNLRFPELEKDSQRRRILAVLKKLNN